MEVVACSQVDSAFCFGDAKRARILSDRPSPGMWGIVPSAQMTVRRIPLTSVRKARGGYRIERTLVVRDTKTGVVSLQAVVEFVEPNGRYAREHSVPAPSYGVDWFIPGLE
jgi:hypothetical protein